jgi:hypothetical protein
VFGEVLAWRTAESRVEAPARWKQPETSHGVDESATFGLCLRPEDAIPRGDPRFSGSDC